MVRRSKLFRLSLVLLGLAGARTASADPISLTGDAAKDFGVSPNPNVVIVDHPFPGTKISNPNAVFQAPFITAENSINGWVIQDLRLNYDPKTDSMAVGVNFFGIAGDADGNGVQGGADPRTTAAGGTETPNLGGRESITVAFDLNKDGKYDVVAGVPADKTQAGPGIDGYNIATYKPTTQGIENAYGATLKNNLGGLFFNPDAQHPDFEFVITNFSKLPGLDLSKGFGIAAYAGSPDDVVAGEDAIAYTLVGNLSPEVFSHTPEPATLVAWTSIVAGSAALRLRRRRRAGAA